MLATSGDDGEDSAGGGPLTLPLPVPPRPLVKRPSLGDFGGPTSVRARRLRSYVLTAYIMVSFLQGFSFATFSMLPDVSADLFGDDTMDLTNLSWTLNCNNVAQAFFIPMAIWLLMKQDNRLLGGRTRRTGLRATVVIAALMQTAQCALWVAASYNPHLVSIEYALFVGACCGGVCTACLQGSVSRLPAVWFPAEQRGTANAMAFSSLFGAQSIAYLVSLGICTTGELNLLLIAQLGASVLVLLPILIAFPDSPDPPRRKVQSRSAAKAKFKPGLQQLRVPLVVGDGAAEIPRRDQTYEPPPSPDRRAPSPTDVEAAAPSTPISSTGTRAMSTPTGPGIERILRSSSPGVTWSPDISPPASPMMGLPMPHRPSALHDRGSSAAAEANEPRMSDEGANATPGRRSPDLVSTCSAAIGDACRTGCDEAARDPYRVVSTLLLMLASALASGCFTAWQQVLPLMFSLPDTDANNTMGMGSDPDEDKCKGSFLSRLIAREGDMLAFSSGVAYALGGPLAGMIADRFFVRRLKRLLQISLTCLCGCFGVIVWAMPPPPWLQPDDGADTAIWKHHAEMLGRCTITASGLFAGAVVPPATELLAEDQLLSEGTSANLVMLFLQVFAFVTVLVVSSLSAPAMNVLMLAAAGTCFLLILPLRENYQRRNNDVFRDSRPLAMTEEEESDRLRVGMYSTNAANSPITFDPSLDACLPSEEAETSSGDDDTKDAGDDEAAPPAQPSSQTTTSEDEANENAGQDREGGDGDDGDDDNDGAERGSDDEPPNAVSPGDAPIPPPEPAPSQDSQPEPE